VHAARVSAALRRAWCDYVQKGVWELT